MHSTVASDADLLREMAKGNENALKSLYDRYWDKVYDYTVYKVGLQDTAEDIVQDIFIELWNRRHNLSIERLESYLFVSAKNKIIDVVRKGIIRKHHEDIAQTIYNPSDRNLDVEEEMAYQELYNAIQRGLEFLPLKTQEIFRLNRLDQLSAKEVSILLEIPLRTVEHHITLAIRTLKIQLRDYLQLLICCVSLNHYWALSLLKYYLIYSF